MGMKRIHDFLTSQSGAVTVDWVVLTAATVGLGLASTVAVRTGSTNLGGQIEASLSGAAVAALGVLGVGADTPFLYDFIILQQSHLDTWNAMVDQMSDEDLINTYVSRINWVEGWIANGNTPHSFGFQGQTDYAYLAWQEMQSRGLTTPDGVTEFPDAWSTHPLNPDNA